MTLRDLEIVARDLGCRLCWDHTASGHYVVRVYAPAGMTWSPFGAAHDRITFFIER